MSLMCENGKSWVMKHGENRRLRWLAFLAVWFFLFSAFLVFCANSGLGIRYGSLEEFGGILWPVKNRLGAVRYTRWDAQRSRPIWSVRFSGLIAENSTLGFFRTALHKVVRIEDFESRIYRYEAGAGGVGDLATEGDGMIRRALGKLANREGTVRCDNIDLSNVSEVRVENFCYEVFEQGRLALGVRSKRAIASYRQSALVLRGHVRIEIADVGTLESNHVEWDFAKERFFVKGVYVLNRGGQASCGRDICVDGQLDNLGVKHSKLEVKEQEQWYAKLQ